MKAKTKPSALIEGALYMVETIQSGDTGGHVWVDVLRWTRNGWRDHLGRKPRGACNGAARRVRFNKAQSYWQVTLLRERVKALEKAGDEMAKWFPFSSPRRERVVGEWTEAKTGKIVRPGGDK